MKKLSTFLFFFLCMTTSFAQIAIGNAVSNDTWQPSDFVAVENDQITDVVYGLVAKTSDVYCQTEGIATVTLSYLAGSGSRALHTLGVELLDENGDDPSVIVRRRLENGRKHDLCAAFLRDREKIGLLLEETAQELRTFSSCRAAGHAALTELLISYDTLVTRYAMLSAIAAYIDDGGLSRGSYRIVGTKGTDEQHRSQVLTTSVRMDENGIAASCSFVPVRPIPDVHNWFETVYNQSEAHP